MTWQEVERRLERLEQACFNGGCGSFRSQKEKVDNVIDVIFEEQRYGRRLLVAVLITAVLGLLGQAAALVVMYFKATGKA